MTNENGLSAEDEYIGGGSDNPAADMLVLANPINSPQPVYPWVLVAHNKRVLSGWLQLCRETPANGSNCFNWLSQHATRIKPRRCYPLKGEVYKGIWAYEIGSGDRIYYKPIDEEKKAIIYYAGKHPSVIPRPPESL